MSAWWAVRILIYIICFYKFLAHEGTNISNFRFASLLHLYLTQTNENNARRQYHFHRTNTTNFNTFWQSTIQIYSYFVYDIKHFHSEFLFSRTSCFGVTSRATQVKQVSVNGNTKRNFRSVFKQNERLPIFISFPLN